MSAVRFLPLSLLGLSVSLVASAEPTLTGATSAPQSLFVRGSAATMTLEAKGLQAGERRPLSIVLKDEYGKEVGEIANDGIAADASGAWKGEFPLKTDFLGFRRICVASGDLTLPKMGSRPKGCLTYAVFTDWNQRPKLSEKDCFFGLQGGAYGKWVGAHFLYSASNPQTDPEKSKAYQRRLLTAEFPIYGTISAEYRFVKPFMTKEAVAYFSARAKDAPRMPFSIPAGDPVGERHLRESLTAFAAAARASRPGRRIYEFALECDINSPDPETTVRTFKVAYAAIHAADPEAQVYAAGVSNVTKQPYLCKLFDLGLAAYMDGFNIHPYTAYPPDRNGFVERIREFVKIVRERKGDVPMISTEQGYAAPFQEELVQAEGNVRVALILLGEGFSMHCGFWGYDFGNDHYNWFDGDYGYNYNLELRTRRWSGLTSPRPVMPAMSAACLFLDGHRPVAALEDLGETAAGYAYADRNGRCVIALWDYGGAPREVSVAVGRDEIDVADMMGNVTRRKTEGGVLKLTLTGSPCYVLGPDAALWGHGGSMKASIARARKLREAREEAKRQARICEVLPHFAGGVPGVRIEVENRTSSRREYSVSTRIPGIPEARRTVGLGLAPHGKGWATVSFGEDISVDPSRLCDVEVTVAYGTEYRTTRKERLNFLAAAALPDGVGANGDFSRWRPRRFRWPVEKGGQKVRMALGWNPSHLLVEVDAFDDVFSPGAAAGEAFRGDGVRLGVARQALAETTGNFQTDVQEEASSELFLSLTPSGALVRRTATFDPARFPVGEVAPADLPRKVTVVTNGSELAIRYQVAVPWGFLNVRSPAPGTVVRLAAVSADADGAAAAATTPWFDLEGVPPRHFAFVALDGGGRGGDAFAPPAAREIGQSQRPGTPPVGWTACAWCVADKDHNVYLPGGWRIRRNSREAEKCVDEVGGHMFSDGCGNIWSWNNRAGEVVSVVVDGDGLHCGGKAFNAKAWVDYRFFAAPPKLKGGFAARAKFGRLRRYQGEIRGYDEGGRDVGVLLDCAAAGLGNAVCAAFDPTTGDLLVGNEWPDRRVHRFTADGREVKTGVWPYPCHTLAIDSVEARDVFFTGSGVERRADTLVGDRRLVFGRYTTETYGLADGGDGWWIATTQGAQHYLKSDPSFCDRRIGGIARADRIGICDGKVLVADGKRLFKLWLDAESDEALCCSERDKVSEKTMPADLPVEADGWRVEYDAVRKAVRVVKTEE